MNLKIILFVFWFFVQIRAILFWVFLWQIKEYRLDRFLLHFQTQKGREIFLNPAFLIKTPLFLVSIIFPQKCSLSIPVFLLIFYFFETTFILFKTFKKDILIPRFTFRSIFLVGTSLFFLGLFSKIFFQYDNFWLFLLILDIFLPLLVCFSIFISAPFRILYKFYLLKRASEKMIQFQGLITIGITGSFGKSSTKEFLATILEKKFKILKTEKNQNTEIAIAKTVLKKLNKEHQIFIAEIGAYKKGEVNQVASILKPKIAILTGLNFQHFGLFKKMENLISGEGGKELVANLEEDGVLILNWENAFLRQIYEKERGKIIKVGINNKKCDLFAEKINVEKERIQFLAKTKEGEETFFEMNLIGFQNIINVLLATACARFVFQMSLQEIAEICKNIDQFKTNVFLFSTKKNFSVIFSTYSTNPDAVFAHLEHLRLWKGKKILIMPCLIELGNKAKEIHSQIGKKIKEICDLAIITSLDFFEEIKKEAPEKVEFLENPLKIFERVINICHSEDVVLLEGRLPNFLLKKFEEIIIKK